MILFDKVVHLLLRGTSEIPRTSLRRTAIAFGFSILIHAAVVWLPQIHLPHDRVHLPPLSVRLEALPEKVAVAEVITHSEEKSELATTLNTPGIKAPGKLLAKVSATMKKMEKSEILDQFPKHLHLFFTVYEGAGNSRIGEIIHEFDIESDRYTLNVIKHTTSMSGHSGQEQRIQVSHGIIGEQGLQPQIYKEDIITSGKKKNLKVSFDWETKLLHFVQGEDVALPNGAQDALSYMYQISQISLNHETVSFFIVTGAALETYEFEIGRPEDIESPIGKLRALRLRKLHKKGEPYFEIWLGLEYRLLPVKFRQINGTGEIIEESIISDIRASDV